MNSLRADSLSCRTGAPRLLSVHRRSPGHICWTTEGLAQLKKQTNKQHQQHGWQADSGDRMQDKVRTSANGRVYFIVSNPVFRPCPPGSQDWLLRPPCLSSSVSDPTCPSPTWGVCSVANGSLRNHTRLSFCCPLLTPL